MDEQGTPKCDEIITLTRKIEQIEKAIYSIKENLCVNVENEENVSATTSNSKVDVLLLKCCGILEELNLINDNIIKL